VEACHSCRIIDCVRTDRARADHLARLATVDGQGTRSLTLAYYRRAVPREEPARGYPHSPRLSHIWRLSRASSRCCVSKTGRPGIGPERPGNASGQLRGLSRNVSRLRRYLLTKSKGAVLDLAKSMGLCPSRYFTKERPLPGGAMPPS
jgi:hypothetical protein